MNHLGELDQKIRQDAAVTEQCLGARRGSAERGRREEERAHSIPEPLKPKVCPRESSAGSFASLEGRVCLGAWKDVGHARACALLSIPTLRSKRQFLINTIELSWQLSG